MRIEKFHIYLADLNPPKGTEPGKIRPVLVVQTNLLNDKHPSTLICPLTTHVIPQAKVLRIHINKGESGLDQDSDVLVDQLRAIDNRRFKKHLGTLSPSLRQQLLESLKILILE
jgi:mRNA interferase MazF